MMLAKRFSTVVKASGNGYFSSVSEIVEGRTMAINKGVFFHLSRDMDHDYKPYQKLIDKCKDLQDTEVILAFDGASKGNPGFAGCGFWFAGPDSNVLGSFDVNLFRATNNEAEYCGMLFGMYCAKLAGLNNLKVLGDSQLVIYQVQGKWRVKAKNLYSYFYAVKELKSEFNSIEFDYIPREDNAKADSLANRAVTKKLVMSERVKQLLEAKKESKLAQNVEPNCEEEPDTNSEVPK